MEDNDDEETQLTETLDMDENLSRKSRRADLISNSNSNNNNNNKGVYDSFRKFDPSRFVENSPEWKMAMIKYLIDMKNHGHKIQEIETTKVTFF
jgi:hypothetical protein